MSNMLNLVERAHKHNISFPIVQSVTFASESDAVTFTSAVKKDEVTARRQGTSVVFRLMNLEQVDFVAQAYFPLLFAESRAQAKVKDNAIRRGFFDVIRGVHRTPHTITIEGSIQTVKNRLAAVDVYVDGVKV